MKLKDKTEVQILNLIGYHLLFIVERFVKVSSYEMDLLDIEQWFSYNETF
jgi:hypothetical protein